MFYWWTISFRPIGREKQNSVPFLLVELKLYIKTRNIDTYIPWHQDNKNILSDIIVSLFSCFVNLFYSLEKPQKKDSSLRPPLKAYWPYNFFCHKIAENGFWRKKFLPPIFGLIWPLKQKPIFFPINGEKFSPKIGGKKNW